MLNYKLAPKIYLKENSTFSHDYIDKISNENALILATDIYFLTNKIHDSKTILHP